MPTNAYLRAWNLHVRCEQLDRAPARNLEPSPFERLPAELLVEIGSYLADDPESAGLCSLRLCNRFTQNATFSVFARTYFQSLAVMRLASSLKILDDISKSRLRHAVTRLALDTILLPDARPRTPHHQTVWNLKQHIVSQQDLIRSGEDIRLLICSALRFPNLYTFAFQHLGILGVRIRPPLSPASCYWGILGSKTLQSATDLCRGEPLPLFPEDPNTWTSLASLRSPNRRLDPVAQRSASDCVEALIRALGATNLQPKTLDVFTGLYSNMGYQVLEVPVDRFSVPMPLLAKIEELRLGLHADGATGTPIYTWLFAASNLRSLHIDLGRSTDALWCGLLGHIKRLKRGPLGGRPFPWPYLTKISIANGSFAKEELQAAIESYASTLECLELDHITLHRRGSSMPLSSVRDSRLLFADLLGGIARQAKGWTSFRFSHIAHSGPERRAAAPDIRLRLGPFPPKGYVFIAPASEGGGGHFKTVSYRGAGAHRALRAIRLGLIRNEARKPPRGDAGARWACEDRWEGAWDRWIGACACDGCALRRLTGDSHIRPGDPADYPVTMDLSS